MAGQDLTMKITRKLTVENSGVIKRDLLNALEQRVTQVVLDFSDTESIDSSGIGKILLFNDKFAEAGGSLRLINVRHPGVKDLFQLINLGKYITIDYNN